MRTSSNAAATLGLLNELWSLGLGDHQLVELGGRLGSDVPVFCRDWPLTIMRGRGELVSPVNRRVGGVLLLIVPQIHSSTVAVYRAFAAAGRRSERPSAAMLMGLDDDAAGSDKSSSAGERELPSITINGAKLMRSLFNDLEEAAFEVNPELRNFAERLRTVSGLPFCMSGSGSAFFCIIDRDTDEQFAYVEGLRDCFPTARVIRTHFVH
ncbi:MAG: hypothetical protein HZB38_03280 [Planctomycetes bacterium]|nr:hypothetical protein [Planctomycetota bacterium]